MLNSILSTDVSQLMGILDNQFEFSEVYFFILDIVSYNA